MGKFDCKEEILSSELIMQCAKAEKTVSDYHTQMNAELFHDYIKNRVIPAFKDKYPGKKMILFVDNATTHDTRGSYPASTSPKSEFAKFLRENGVTSIEVQRVKAEDPQPAPQSFPSSTWDERAPHGPTKEMLEVACWKALRARTPTLFIRKTTDLLREHGFIVVYNSPNTPENQPVELFNGYVKHHVKKTVVKNRGIPQLYNDILDGMYGGTQQFGVVHKGVDAALCKKWISHCHKFMDKAIKDYGIGVDEKTSIHSLWTPDSEYSAWDIEYLKPITDKRMDKLKVKFELKRYHWDGESYDVEDNLPPFERYLVCNDENVDSSNHSNSSTHNRRRRQ